MMALRFIGAAHPPLEAIEWLKANVGHPELPNTWRIINIGFIKFVLFANDADGLMTQLNFVDDHRIEILDEVDTQRLLA
jgi:SRSO17 transposase